MTRLASAIAIALGLVVSALFWIDVLFIPLALVGPLVWGAVSGLRRLPLSWPLVVAVVAGLGAVISDWVVNHEDVAFHLVLTVLMAALAAFAWWVASRFRRAPA